ncbi:hypothetical protein C8J57DRAFT_1224188 [Mycena rebaudengoi]|nr:hypothetical protein C8J57DRAFT_1224188 [Mycena rebaudengoi]
MFRMLSHLARCEPSAVAIVEVNILNLVEKLLRSYPLDLYEYIFPMLESLVSHKSTATTVLDMHLYDLLATLWGFSKSSSEDLHKILQSTPAASVVKLLACIARWREGAEGIVTARSLDNIRAGFNSLNIEIRLSTCKLLRALVGHESTVQAVLAIVPREDIVALARGVTTLLSSEPFYRLGSPALRQAQALDVAELRRSAGVVVVAAKTVSSAAGSGAGGAHAVIVGGGRARSEVGDVGVWGVQEQAKIYPSRAVRASRPFNPRFKQCLNGSKRHFAPGFELVPQVPAYISRATGQQASDWANQE